MGLLDKLRRKVLQEEGEIMPIPAKKPEAVPYTGHKILFTTSYAEEKICPYCRLTDSAYGIVNSYTSLEKRIPLVDMYFGDPLLDLGNTMTKHTGKKLGLDSMPYPTFLIEGRLEVGTNTVVGNIGKLEQAIFDRD